MKVTAKHIETPIGNLPAPLSPAWTKELAECETNEDLFKLVLSPCGRFVSPDAWAEIEARMLVAEYYKWESKKEA